MKLTWNLSVGGGGGVVKNNNNKKILCSLFTHNGKF